MFSPLQTGLTGFLSGFWLLLPRTLMVSLTEAPGCLDCVFGVSVLLEGDPWTQLEVPTLGTRCSFLCCVQLFQP